MDNATLIKNLEVPKGIVDAVLDTDAYNEIDDQFAIAYMLRSTERINVRAIYAAPFHNDKSTGPKDGMEKSYNEILKVVDLVNPKNRPEILKGSDRYLKSEDDFVKTDASEHLVKLAMQYSPENPLYVVAIGAITNVASAINMEPKIKDKIVIVWLGGNGWYMPDNNEFNLVQDIAGARVVFGCGAPFVQLPCAGVVDVFRVSQPELEKFLVGKNPLADYLAKNAIKEMSYMEDSYPWTRVIWDVTAVAWLLNDNDCFMQSSIEQSPIPEYDNVYGYSKFRHPMRYVYHIHRDNLMKALFDKLLK